MKNTQDATHRPNALLPAAVLLASLSACGGAGSSAQDLAETFTTKRGNLRITVTDNGDTESADKVVVKNEVEGRSTIIWLIAEGSLVKKGDELVKLDSSQLIERRATQAISLARAEASMISARKDLEILGKQVESEILAARNAVTFAQMDQEKFLGFLPAPTEPAHAGDDAVPMSPGFDPTTPTPGGSSEPNRARGERQKEIEDANINIKLAREELELARERFEWSNKLYAQEFITKNEYDRDRVALERAQSEVRKRETEKRLLVQFDHRKREIEFAQRVREAEVELERTQARTEAQLAQKSADVRSTEAEFGLAREQFENLVQQIEKTTVKAPSDGLVIYYADRNRWGRGDTIEEGAEVRERQPLIVLPNISRMVATLALPEADVDKVRLGQTATVRVDAFADRTFTARVRQIAPLPDSGSRFTNPDLKVYPTQVEIDGEHSELRPGMSCTIEILVQEVVDCLYIPLAAVHRDRSVHYCWVARHSGPEAVRVQLGPNDSSFVQITSGLEEGATVFLTRPAGAQPPTYEQPKVVDALVSMNQGHDRTEYGSGSAAQEPAPRSGGNRRTRPSDRAGFDFAAFKRKSDSAKAKVLAARPDLASKLRSRSWTTDAEVQSELGKVAPEFLAELKKLRSR